MSIDSAKLNLLSELPGSSSTLAKSCASSETIVIEKIVQVSQGPTHEHGHDLDGKITAPVRHHVHGNSARIRLFVQSLTIFVLFVVGWRIGRVLALNGSELSLSVTLPLNRPTPVPTLTTNASNTEFLMAKIENSRLPLTSVNVITHTRTQGFIRSQKLGSLEEYASGAIHAGDDIESTIPDVMHVRSDYATRLVAVPLDMDFDSVSNGASLENPAAAQGNLSTHPVELLEPAESHITSGVVLLRWSANFELGPQQNYEAVAWLDGQDPLRHGISLAPLTFGTQVKVDFARLESALRPLFTPGAYRWGVMLVQRNPYQRIALLSNAQTIHYDPRH